MRWHHRPREKSSVGEVFRRDVVAGVGERGGGGGEAGGWGAAAEVEVLGLTRARGTRMVGVVAFPERETQARSGANRRDLQRTAGNRLAASLVALDRLSYRIAVACAQARGFGP